MVTIIYRIYITYIHYIHKQHLKEGKKRYIRLFRNRKINFFNNSVHKSTPLRLHITSESLYYPLVSPNMVHEDKPFSREIIVSISEYSWAVIMFDFSILLITDIDTL